MKRNVLFCILGFVIGVVGTGAMAWPIIKGKEDWGRKIGRVDGKMAVYDKIASGVKQNVNDDVIVEEVGVIDRVKDRRIIIVRVDGVKTVRIK